MNATINIGDVYTSSKGTPIVVNSYFDSYGEDVIYYKVSYNGSEKLMAVCSNLTPEQKNKITSDAAGTPPYPCSDYPIDVCDDILRGVFAYICDIMPESYATIGDILTKNVSFSSITAKIDAAISIADAFCKYSFAKVAVTDFFENFIGIDPKTGKVFFSLYQCLDTDLSKAVPFYRFCPAEILRCEAEFSFESNKYLLATLLFTVFFSAHPLEGRSLSHQPYLSKELATEIYANNPVFIMDPDDDSNRPDAVLQGTIEPLWGFYPKMLTELFTQALSSKACTFPESRPSYLDWLKALSDSRSRIYICSSCRRETFVSADNNAVCQHCKNTMEITHSIRTYSGVIPAFDHGRIYFCQSGEFDASNATNPVGLIISNPSKPSELGIKNITGETWSVTTPSGNRRNVAPKEVVPFMDSIKITVSNGVLELIKNEPSVKVPVFSDAHEDNEPVVHIVPTPDEAILNGTVSDDTASDDDDTEGENPADADTEAPQDGVPAEGTPADDGAPEGDAYADGISSGDTLSNNTASNDVPINGPFADNPKIKGSEDVQKSIKTPPPAPDPTSGNIFNSGTSIFDKAGYLYKDKGESSVPFEGINAFKE